MTTGVDRELVVCPLAFWVLGDIATTSAAQVDVGVLLPAMTAAVLAPLIMETAPEEIDVIAISEEAITVGFEDSVTVQTEEAITVGLDDRVIVLTELFGDRLTTSAFIEDVTALALPVMATVTGADVLPLEIGAPTAIN